MIYLQLLTIFPRTYFWLKESAHEDFRSDENGRKFSKPVENTVEKGEIAQYKQFLLFSHFFQQAYRVLV